MSYMLLSTVFKSGEFRKHSWSEINSWVLPHCMQCRRGLAIRKLSVRPSVLSVKRVDCDKGEEIPVQIFIPYERTFSLVFWEEEWLVEATTSTWNFGSIGPRWSEIADFRSLFAGSDSAVTPSEKSSINTNRKSTTRFPITPRLTSYIVPKPPKGGSKTQCPKFEQ